MSASHSPARTRDAEGVVIRHVHFQRLRSCVKCAGHQEGCKDVSQPVVQQAPMASCIHAAPRRALAAAKITLVYNSAGAALRLCHCGKSRRKCCAVAKPFCTSAHAGP